MSSTAYVDINNYLQTLETEIDADNADAIHEFIDYCAAEGLTETRQQRNAQSLKMLIKKFAPDDFQLQDATEEEIRQVVAALHRSDYAASTKETMKSAIKKFYRIQNGGRTEPEKTKFFSIGVQKEKTVTRDDLFTEDELKRLFRAVNSTRDRAMLMVFYESAARPGELLSLNISDFTSNGKGDFVHLEGLKGTPDRTNQFVRAGRTLREWLAQHPLGGELGDIDDPTAPLWVKTEQQECQHCGDIPQNHDDESCDYEPDLADRMTYSSFLRRFKQACEDTDIPDNKRRPYNLRHTRLTEVATFMGYEQLNKFAGWVPGSDRAKVYVHLNNDDVNKAIRDEYGLESDNEEEKSVECAFCGTENQSEHAECRTCGRPLSLKEETKTKEKQRVIERLAELEEKGVLEKLNKLEGQI